MFLEDIVDDKFGFVVDDNPFIGNCFGKNSQLKVVGWSGKNSANNKYYILKCDVCSQDTELFGEGYFKSVSSPLLAGNLPCGCSPSHSWTEGEQKVRVSRKAQEFGYTFTGWKEDVFKNSKTRCILNCNLHGNWESRLDVVVNKPSCPECKKMNQRHSDEYMVKSFMVTGAFHPNTKFWRSERLNTQGRPNYWKYICGACGDLCENLLSNIRRGTTSCSCDPWAPNQKQAYINLISDNESALAIKFGISSQSEKRLVKISKKTNLNVQQLRVYEFNSVEDCRQAEELCKTEFYCGVLSKRDFPDGYTETTFVSNLDQIIKIYEDFGGIRVL